MVTRDTPGAETTGTTDTETTDTETTDTETTDTETTELVRAAGGVVLRSAGNGEYETCLVHRPRYDDWSLPKGKLDDEESFQAAALREVGEETGHRCELGARLGSVRYRDSHGRPKVVRYWVMWPDAGEGRFTSDDEIDRIEWVGVREAPEILTYWRGRDLLAQAVEAVGGGAA